MINFNFGLLKIFVVPIETPLKNVVYKMLVNGRGSKILACPKKYILGHLQIPFAFQCRRSLAFDY